MFDLTTCQEPHNCTAFWDGDKLTIWDTNQHPHGIKISAVLSSRSIGMEVFSYCTVPLTLDKVPTVMALHTAEVLNVPYEMVRSAYPDTDVTPYAPSSAASRQTRQTGWPVLLAAQEVKRKLFDVAATMLKVKPEESPSLKLIQQRRSRLKTWPGRVTPLQQHRS